MNLKMRFPILLLAAILIMHGRAQTTINPTSNYAYGANIGWLNFRASALDGVVVGEAYLAGHLRCNPAPPCAMAELTDGSIVAPSLSADWAQPPRWSASPVAPSISFASGPSYP